MSAQIIDELIELTKGETIRLFRSEDKKAYKYLLCGILRDIFFHGNFYRTVPTFYGWAKSMLLVNELRLYDSVEGYPAHIITCKQVLSESYFNNPNDVDGIIHFFREMLRNMKEKGKTLITVSDLNKIIDCKSYFKSKDIPLKQHQWIDVTFTHGLIPTHPEFFNYLDVISFWNDFISKKELFDSDLEMDSSNERELNYSIISSMRWLVIQGVTFVESYLYYCYFNLIHSPTLQPRIPKLKGHVQDTQIIEQVLYKLFPETTKKDSEFIIAYNKYQQILKLRDRFVHTSAFTNQANHISEIQPLLSINANLTAEYLDACFCFVYRIEDLLPPEEKVLHWRDRFEHPNFLLFKKISPLRIR